MRERPPVASLKPPALEQGCAFEVPAFGTPCAESSHALCAGTDCPVCAGGALPCQCASLATTHPGLADEMRASSKNSELSPSHVKAGSGKPVWWKGSCGHEWQAKPSNRSSDLLPTGCPQCALLTSRASRQGTHQLSGSGYTRRADGCLHRRASQPCRD